VSEPQVHLPSPTVWPFVLGAGVSLAALGIATSYYFTLVGVGLVVRAIVGWIGEMRHA
jgi:hypothetical protein